MIRCRLGGNRRSPKGRLDVAHERPQRLGQPRSSARQSGAVAAPSAATPLGTPATQAGGFK